MYCNVTGRKDVVKIERYQENFCQHCFVMLVHLEKRLMEGERGVVMTATVFACTYFITWLISL